MTYILPTVTDFVNAKTDADDLAEIVNGDASTVVGTRYGGNKNSVSRAIAQALAVYATINNRGAWQASTAYSVNDIWQHTDDTWYLVLALYTSNAADIEVDIASGNVAVYQNVSGQRSPLRFESIELLKTAMETGIYPVKTVSETDSFYLDEFKGGNKYTLLNAGSYGAIPTPITVGDNIPIGVDGLYLKALFPGDKPNVLHFGAGRGNKAEDTAAVQALIDLGYAYAYLPAIENDYFVERAECTTRPFSLVGDGGEKGTKNTIITVEDTCLVIGTFTGGKKDNFVPFENITFRVQADILTGILDMRSCRNVSFINVNMIETLNDNYIGTLVRSNRCYQMHFSQCTLKVKGFSIIEIGDKEVSEVLDTFTWTNIEYNGNAAIFQRSGVFNLHNLKFNNAKFRETFQSPEDDLDNQGMTYLSVQAEIGDTQLTVSDISQLRKGLLVAGDLIYIGMRVTAELLRVSSISGNIIYLETPCRFLHYANVGGTGFGEPVIYGPVYITLDSTKGIGVDVSHFERGWAAWHVHAMLGATFDNIFTTSKALFMPSSHGRSVTVGVVTGGEAGWENFGDTLVYVYRRPSHAQGDIESWKIGALPEIQADHLLEYKDASISSTDFIWSYTPPNEEIIIRSFTETYVEARRAKTVTVEMDGAIDTLRLQQGLIHGQRCKVRFKQDATGKRILYNYDYRIILTSEFKLSLPPFAVDELEFRWDHDLTEWHEVNRVRGADSLPLSKFSYSELIDEANNINTVYRYDGLMIIYTLNGQVLRSDGAAPNSPWVDMSGTTVITPAP